MVGEIDILNQLITVAPVVAVLLWVVIHFKGELKKRDETIAELNTELRTSEKENITVMKDTNSTLQLLIAKLNAE
jgi:hypothetical protein